MSDRLIIEQILKRDRHALYRFYRLYTPKLSRFIKTKVNNPHDAEELLQDTLYAFLEAIRDFTGKSSIQTFLFSICQHKIVDYYRRKKMKQIVFSQMPALEMLVSPLVGPEEKLEERFVAEKIDSVFMRLLPQYERILRFRYVQGLSVRAIAQTLLVTLKSAESQLTRAKKAFAQAFSSS